MFVFLDLEVRGKQKFGDVCKEDNDCGFDGSFCNPDKKKCYCRPEFPVTNHIDKCGVRKFLSNYINLKIIIN